MTQTVSLLKTVRIKEPQQEPINNSSADGNCWLAPPPDLKLAANEAHIWLARLDAEKTENLEEIMSGDERARADRFRFATHKKQFIAARGILRIILGKYLQTDPRQVCFDYGEFGKPAIAREHKSEIKFNLSHSNDMALYAIAHNREVGVDIEQINPSIIDDGMISYCLTGHEKANFQALPKSKRDLFFLECWTRKEAFLKGCGKGFSLQPNQIETLSVSNVSMNFSDFGWGFQPGFWSLRTIPLIPGYAAAFSIEGNSPQLSFWR